MAQVPRHTFSLWNDWQATKRLSAGLGILYRSDMFAAIDNSVTLPGFTRVDLPAFDSVSREVRVQANLENAFDRTYWLNADNTTNLSPGFARTLRVAILTRF